MAPPNALVSCLPGRIRLRHPALRQPAERTRLAATLAAIDGMLSVDANPAVGSLLLHYDPTRRARAAMEAQVAAQTAQALDAAAAPIPEQPTADTVPDDALPCETVPDATADATADARRRRRSTAKRLNRLAKLGMLASLPLSLAAVAFGGKRLHAVSGGAFTLLLLAHLVIHRRHLLQ